MEIRGELLCMFLFLYFFVAVDMQRLYNMSNILLHNDIRLGANPRFRAATLWLGVTVYAKYS
jgi:hypothetical protein